MRAGASDRGAGRERDRRDTVAVAIALLALLTALGGSAWAALDAGAPRLDRGPQALPGKRGDRVAQRRHRRRRHPGRYRLGRNSVGRRQLKGHAVNARKLAPGAVTGRAVLRRTLTGADIDLGRLGTVPSASHVQFSTLARSLAGHGAGCPAGAALVRGVCIDGTLRGPVPGVAAAAASCAALGGALPSAMELYSVRSVVHLGSGSLPEYAVADDFFANTSTKSDYSSMTVDAAGEIRLVAAGEAVGYVCAYPLVR
jgi:hypothetical protein